MDIVSARFGGATSSIPGFGGGTGVVNNDGCSTEIFGGGANGGHSLSLSLVASGFGGAVIGMGVNVGGNQQDNGGISAGVDVTSL